MRKLNLSKSETNKSPQRTKSFLAMLVLALGLFLGMVVEEKADPIPNPNLSPCQFSNTPGVENYPWQGPKIYDLDDVPNCPGCKVKVAYYDRMVPKPDDCRYPFFEYQLNVTGIYLDGNCNNCSTEYITKLFVQKIWQEKYLDPAFESKITGNGSGCGGLQTLYTEAYCKNQYDFLCDSKQRCCETKYGIGPNGLVDFGSQYGVELATEQPFPVCEPPCTIKCFDIFRGDFVDFRCIDLRCTDGEWLNKTKNVTIPGEPGCYLEVHYKTRFNKGCSPAITDIRIEKIIRKGCSNYVKPQTNSAYYSYAYQSVITDELNDNPRWRDIAAFGCFDEIRTSNGACWTWSSSYNPLTSPESPDTLMKCVRDECCW